MHLGCSTKNLVWSEMKLRGVLLGSTLIFLRRTTVACSANPVTAFLRILYKYIMTSTHSIILQHYDLELLIDVHSFQGQSPLGLEPPPSFMHLHHSLENSPSL